MNIAAPASDAEQRVSLLLTDTAHHLTGRDFLKITGVARQARAIVHIHCGSWQVLVSVPKAGYRKVERALQAMGYEARILPGEIHERSTFVLKGW